MIDSDLDLIEITMNNSPNIPVRSIRDGEWFWVNRSLLHKQLGKIRPIGLALYCLFAASANRRQCCYPSHQYLANLLRCHRVTVHRALRNLEKNGLIQSVKSSRRQTLYYLLKTP